MIEEKLLEFNSIVRLSGPSRMTTVEWLHRKLFSHSQAESSSSHHFDYRIDTQSIVYKYLRFLLALFSEISGIPMTRRAHDGAKEKSDALSLQKIMWSKGQWFGLPQTIMVIYWLSNVHMSASLFYQYKYDLHSFQLHQLTKKQLMNQADLNQTNRLLGRLEMSRRSLIAFGCPHANASFMVEPAYLLMMFVAFNSYLFLLIYFRYFEPYEDYTVEDVFDQDLGEKKAIQLLDRLLEKFARSRKTFFSSKRLKLGFEEAALEAVCSEPSFTNGRSKHCFEISINQCLVDHRPQKNHANLMQSIDAKYLTRRRVSCMQLTYTRWLDLRQRLDKIYDHLECLKRNGTLRPYNRSTKWIELRMIVHLFYFNWCFFYGSTILYLMISNLDVETTLPSASTLGQEPHLVPAFGYEARRQSNSRLIEVEFMFICAMVMVTTTYYCANLLVRSLDQIMMVKKTMANLRSCNLDNSLLLESFRQFRTINESASRDQILEQLNLNLLMAVLNFKIFINQFSACIKSFKVFIIAVSFMINFPIICKFHISYLPEDTFAKTYVTVLSMAPIIPANVCMVPLCYLYARCLDLFKPLSSLMAHVIETSELYNDDRFYVYDEHTVSMLRRELDTAGQTQEFISAKAFGMACTYPLLCKLHFWAGIIIITSVASKHNGDSQLVFNALLM